MPAFFLGAGLHTGLGSNVDDCIAALHAAPPQPESVPCSLDSAAGAIPYHLLAGLAADDSHSRLERVIFEVIRQALDEAGLSPEQQRNTALFLGSSSFEISGEESRYRAALAESERAIPLIECGMGNLAERIRRRLGLRGEDYTFNTACTSSANALWYASKLIEQGSIDHALVVAVEFVNNTTTYGFQSLQLLSPNSMRPFDKSRNGLVLGESCAALVLGKETLGPVPGRGLRSAAFHLRGAANTCDTYSMSTTNEDGSAVRQVIASALENARLAAGEVAAIKCHGTATMSGDAAEARGTLASFPDLPPCTSFKPFIGHTLGACGLAELILFCKAVEQGFLPATPGIAAGDSGLDLSLLQKPKAIGRGHFMLNYFGFGGNSTSLVISNQDPEVAP